MTLDQRLWKHSRTIKIAVQIIYWLVYLIAIYAILKATGDPFDPVEYIQWVAVNMPIKWALFYGFYYFLIPKWFAEKTLKFIGVCIALLFGYPFLKLGLDNLLGIISLPTIEYGVDDEMKEGQVKFWVEIARRVNTVFWSIFFAFVVRFVVDWFKNLRIKAQMEKEGLKSELAMLRNQVNPHFLFNVLNNIDTLVYPHSKEASEAIMKLSSIMRYMLYESNTDWVALEREMDYLEAYIELQKMRLKTDEHINLELNGANKDLLIPPMILIPFVENAFKHASVGKSGPQINMRLITEDDKIVFTVANNVNNQNSEKDELGGIGLQNVKRRLALIYKEQYKLDIDQKEGQYSVNLELYNPTK